MIDPMMFSDPGKLPERINPMDLQPSEAPSAWIERVTRPADRKAPRR